MKKITVGSFVIYFGSVFQVKDIVKNKICLVGLEKLGYIDKDKCTPAKVTKIASSGSLLGLTKLASEYFHTKIKLVDDGTVKNESGTGIKRGFFWELKNRTFVLFHI
jgi:hypothetical protein